MDNSSSSMRKQAQPFVGQVKKKKKQGKDEADRIKQAEKKKRRLEKALATSLAIRTELENKKQRNKEGLQEDADEESWADAAKKKKQEKDELERIKQAEKKKIRIEKAIANSAAIAAELQMKKLRKLEEQRRLDEEGAAVAEAVALHVLLGEDSDDYQERGFMPWDDYTANLNLFAGRRNRFFPPRRCSSPVVHRSRVGDCNCPVSYEPFARGWDNNNMGISADLSSLQISENARVDALVFNGMFRR